jgi:hypothetical protein
VIALFDIHQIGKFTARRTTQSVFIALKQAVRNRTLAEVRCWCIFERNMKIPRKSSVLGEVALTKPTSVNCCFNTKERTRKLSIAHIVATLHLTRATSTDT